MFCDDIQNMELTTAPQSLMSIICRAIKYGGL